MASVEDAIDELTTDERHRAVVLTLNYGEAGDLTLLGGDEMPPVHSGHNSFGDWGPPEDERDVAILADGEWIWTIDNAAEIDHQERGASIWICREPRAP